MESLLNSLEEFGVSQQLNSPYAEHPRFSQYKSKTTGSSQQERRWAILKARKSARYDLLMHLRQIEEGTKQDEDDSAHEAMDYSQSETHGYRQPYKYKNFIMLSEWLVDVDEDFKRSYFAVPCPVGKRCLLVASRGLTKVYAKNGYQVCQFPSLLPGGSGKTAKYGCAMMDCIWVELGRTYYILDLIAWHNQAFVDCETEFRFTWLVSRLAEYEHDVSLVSKSNQNRFVRLPFSPCTQEALTQLLSEPMPFSAPVDGILFYHKETHYTHGPTPLVGWLKPYMLPEILNIPIPTKYLDEMPPKYTNIQNYIEDYDEERKKKRNRRCRRKDKMEVGSDQTSSVSLVEEVNMD